MTRISLLHPSRSRPDKSIKNALDWHEKSGVRDVDLIVSLDNSDPMLNKYIERYEDGRYNGDYRIIFYDNNSVVQATNKACEWAKGDILIYLSDDFSAPENWGQLVLKEFEGVTEPMLIKVDDCLQAFHVPVLTIPIMNRALYEKLGYFWHPEYKSMFCDTDLYETVNRIGALKKCPHLKFPHEHHSIGRAENDETYRQSERNWEQGQTVFNKRLSETVFPGVRTDWRKLGATGVNIGEVGYREGRK